MSLDLTAPDMTERDRQAYGVACPKCKTKKGDPCFRVPIRPGTDLVMVNPHQERRKKAKK